MALGNIFLCTPKLMMLFLNVVEKVLVFTKSSIINLHNVSNEHLRYHLFACLTMTTSHREVFYICWGIFNPP